MNILFLLGWLVSGLAGFFCVRLAVRSGWRRWLGLAGLLLAALWSWRSAGFDGLFWPAAAVALLLWYYGQWQARRASSAALLQK